MIPMFLALGLLGAFLFAATRRLGLREVAMAALVAMVASLVWGLIVQLPIAGSALAAANLLVGAVVGMLLGVAARALGHWPA